MFEKTHRITSGFNENGQSLILKEENIEKIVPYAEFPCFQLQNLFYTEDSPQSLDTRHNDSAYDINLPEGAMRVLKLRMPTQKEMTDDLIKAGQQAPDNWHTFNLHSTDSVDYIYILSGAITYVVGEDTRELKTGDFVTQIGPEHTWINPHDEPCYLLCIMQGIKPSGQRKDMSL